MNWLRRMMLGRYGSDQLSMAAALVYVLLSLLLQIFGFRWGNLVLLPLLIWLFWRMFSRNLAARRKENEAFLRFWNRIRKKCSDWKKRLSDHSHRYFRCPSCSATLRVPKGKGKISIRCPRCRAEFVRKT